MDPIYGPNGHVAAWLERPDCVRSLDGAVIGWLHGDAVHGLGGQHVGYFNDGLFRDQRGDVVAWVTGARGGPVKPVKQAAPIRPIRQVRPVRAIRQIRQVRAVKSLHWSSQSIEAYLPSR
ncbi:4-fold beta flower protein [uncultured Pseudokineococcus sp.]|uniref:4-fold beta flower protein n=1 Tax=uncultured Pseudokineococcus sp. TaxID=1642928 RepID=UPI00260E553B|nr:hypothetical protein [uncultured Pseudokineococcus sp.]